MIFFVTVQLFKKSKSCLSVSEWSAVRKSLDLPEELTHNGRSEPQQPEETQVLPVAAAGAPHAQVKVSCTMLTVL